MAATQRKCKEDAVDPAFMLQCHAVIAVPAYTCAMALIALVILPGLVDMLGQPARAVLHAPSVAIVMCS